LDKHFNILKDLANYKPSPPEIAFKAIRKSFIVQKNVEFSTTLKNLTDIKVAPPSFIYNAVLENILDKKFGTNSGLFYLKDFTSAPPIYLVENIFKQIQSKNKRNIFFRIININVNRKFILQIAASLLLCLLATLCIHFGFHNVSSDKARTFDNADAPVTHAVIADSALKVIPPQPKSEIKIIALHFIKKNKKRAIAKPIMFDGTELLKETSFIVNGVNMVFVDNDFFATFTSFNNVTTDFLNNVPEGKDVTVTLNNFSAISISSKMQEMMKKMYKTKKNGRIPNSAKKLQKKLLDWKVDDTKTFDLDFKKNPVDALDLLDYLFDHP